MCGVGRSAKVEEGDEDLGGDIQEDRRGLGGEEGAAVGYAEARWIVREDDVAQGIEEEPRVRGVLIGGGFEPSTSPGVVGLRGLEEGFADGREQETEDFDSVPVERRRERRPRLEPAHPRRPERLLGQLRYTPLLPGAAPGLLLVPVFFFLRRGQLFSSRVFFFFRVFVFVFVVVFFEGGGVDGEAGQKQEVHGGVDDEPREGLGPVLVVGGFLLVVAVLDGPAQALGEVGIVVD
mmetsp:Transcript_37440/g.120119  ORF Transcript_37440/g.120119 Transcript_37440/m.120119 type:complete len:235 (+) Transcript_37440:2189-2893(+)